MGLQRVVHTDRLTIYQGEAADYVPDVPIDLVLTNPYGPLPAALYDTPALIHQWAHRKADAEAWCGGAHLSLVSFWNDDREAMWAANMASAPLDLTDLRPEPGGWYPPELPRRLLQAYARPGMTIWDGFMGRGTVAAVALELGMRYVGVERLPQHVALAREFLRDLLRDSLPLETDHGAA